MNSFIKKAGSLVLASILLAFISFSLSGCGFLSDDDGGGSIGRNPGAEDRSLYGTSETVGVYGVTVGSGGVSVSPVTNVLEEQLADLSGTSAWNGSGFNTTFIVTNSTTSDMTGVALRISTISPSSTAILNGDGDNHYNFGNIASGQSATVDYAGFSSTGGDVKFYARVTQVKEQVTIGVIDETGGVVSSASAFLKSLFTVKREDGKAVHVKGAGKAISTGAIPGAYGGATSVKIDSAGNPKVSYVDVTNQDLKYAFWNGTQWTNVTIDSTGDTGFYSTLALTSAGNPRIAYYYYQDSSENPTEDLKYAYCNSACDNSGNWGTITIDSAGDTGGYSSISIYEPTAGDVRPRIAYYDFTNNRLRFAACDIDCHDSNNWTKTTLDSTSGFVGEYASLYIEGPTSVNPGKHHLSYYLRSNATGTASGDLKYGACSSNCSIEANWTFSTIDSGNDVGGYTSVAVDPTTGYPKISYYDFTNMDLRYASYGTNYSSGSIGLGSENLLNTTAYDQSPDIISYTEMMQTRYRMYYTISTTYVLYYDIYGNPIYHSYRHLAYRSTTDSNPPAANCSNCTAEAYLGIGVAYDDVMYPKVIQLANGTYRLYYKHVNTGLIYYRDTTDTNPPSAANLPAAATNALSLPAVGSIGTIDIIQLSDNKYRLYVSYYYNLHWELQYMDTTDTNPPDAANITAATPVYSLYTGADVYNQAFGPEIYKFPSGTYRMFYGYYNGSTWQVYYKDTVNTSPPDATNLGNAIGLGIPNGVNPEVIELPTGYVRFYYSAGGGLAFKDGTTPGMPTPTPMCCGWTTLALDGYAQYQSTDYYGTITYVRPDMGAYSSLSINPGGAPVISYYYQGNYATTMTTDTGDLKYAYCLTNCDMSTNWTKGTSDTSGNTGWFTSSAMTSNNYLFITFYNSSTYTLSITGFKHPMPSTAIDVSNVNAGRIQSMKLDSNDNPHIAYTVTNGLSTDTTASLKYAYWSGAAWKTVTIDTSTPNGGLVLPSITLTSTGKPRILYTWNRDYLKYAYCDSACDLAGSWTLTTLATAGFDPLNSPPDNSNLGAATSLNVGWAGNYDASGPEVIRRSDNSKYRMYYSQYNNNNTATCTGGYDFYGTCLGWTYTYDYYWQIAYTETSDTNPPTASCTNCGAGTSTGTGTTNTSQAMDPEVIRLSNSKYRLYYAYKSGTYWQLAYRETTDTNPPASTNLGTQATIATGSSTTDQAKAPKLLQLSSGNYRMYYSYYNGTTWQLAYRDTTDGAPPASACANCGAQTLLGQTGASDPEVVQRPAGGYRLYFSYNSGTYYYLYYRDTLDANEPSSTNLGTAIALNTYTIYSFAQDRMYNTSPGMGPDVILRPGGGYRIYYGYNAGVHSSYTVDIYGSPTAYYWYWGIAYKDTQSAVSSLKTIGPSLTLNASDQPRISFWSNNALQYAYCNYSDATCNTSGNWTTTLVDTNVGIYPIDAGATTSILVDSSDRPRIAYYDAVNADLRYTFCNGACNNSLSWTNMTIASSNTTGKYAVLQANPSGNLRIAASEQYTQSGIPMEHVNYLECNSTCASPTDWTLRSNITVGGVWYDTYGTGWPIRNKTYNNPFIVDIMGYPRINTVITEMSSSAATLTNYKCSTGCATTGTWSTKSLVAAQWSAIGLDYFTNTYTTYYNGAGLYFRWDFVP